MSRLPQLLSAGTAILLCLPACLADDPGTLVVPLPIASAAGFQRRGDSWVPLPECLNLSGPGAVVWEAEQPDEVLWQPAGGVRRDPDGVVYARGYTLLRYYCHAAQRVNVTLWARMRHEQHSALYLMGHQWSSERDFREQGQDPAAALKEAAGQWRWVRLQTFPLAAGFHYVQATYSWPGSPDLDQFAVLFDAARPEATPLQTSRAALTDFWLESDEVHLPAAQTLTAARVVAQSAAGTLVASTDGGQTWQEPRGLPLAGPFRLRLRIPAAALAGSDVQGFQATLQVDPARCLVADNGFVRVCVDTANHGIFRLDWSHRPASFSTPPKAVPLFSLELKKRGEPWPDPRRIIGPADGQLLSAHVAGPAHQRTATLNYSLLDGQIRATVTIALGEGNESLWSLALDNRSEWDILTYNFPRLAGLKIGWSGYDDRWLNTNIYGPWMGGAPPEDRPYPGWGALGYADLYDEQAGLSLATRDPEDGLTNFALRPEAIRFGDSCSLETQKQHCVPAGKQRTWTYALLLHPGDWHAAADAYGEWFRGKFGTADHWPEWVRDDNGWVQFSCALADKTFQWPQLLEYWEQARRLNLNHLQIWGQFGSSACSSFWWPSPKYGPIEQFAAVNKQIRDAGGHIGYYLMYCLENRYNQLDTETYEGYLPRAAYPPGVPVLGKEALIAGCMVDDPTGKVTAWPTTDREMSEFRANLARLLAEGKTTTWADSETWPKHSMVTMNPLDPVWQKWLTQWTVGLYTEEWNCDSPYQDVLGAGNVGRSFDLRRGDHGEVYNAERLLAQRLAEEGRQADPQYCLVAEGKQEQVTRWATGMTSNAHYGWIDLAAHRYTHPDHILYMGAANGGYTQLVKNCELAYLYGARFDLIVMGDVRALRRTVTFRDSFKRFCFRARYMDTVGLKVSGQGLRATRHDRTERGVNARLITVVNEQQTADGILELEPLPGPAFWLTDDGKAAQASFAQGETGTTFTRIPPHRLSALLLVAQPPRDEEYLSNLVAWPTPRGYTARLWLANLTRATKQLRLTLQGIGPEQPLEIALEPGGVYNQDLPVILPPDTVPSGFLRLTQADRTLAQTFLYPTLDDPSFEKSGTPLADAPDGERVARLGPVKGWQGVSRLLNVEPDRKYLVTVSARRSGEQGNMFGLVRLRSAARGWQYTRLDFPAGVFNRWVVLTGEFTVPTDLTEADLYLYNMDSEVAVDYDAIAVKMLE